jgi:hypothetical protein
MLLSQFFPNDLGSEALSLKIPFEGIFFHDSDAYSTSAVNLRTDDMQAFVEPLVAWRRDLQQWLSTGLFAMLLSAMSKSNAHRSGCRAVCSPKPNMGSWRID